MTSPRPVYGFTEALSASLGEIALLRPKVLITLFLLYLLLIRLIRYRILRINNSTIENGSPLSSMTVASAQKIMHRIAQQEFPSLFKVALQFALFRTYGIPTISQLLLETSLFTEYHSASKRYVDTRALVSEMLVRKIGSKEWIEAVARLNCIHGKYKVSKRISNDDMLYTLSLFAREPVLWIERYEWRQLGEVEKCAVGVIWKTIGDAMQIEMHGLRSSEWKDGLHWYTELCEWSEQYEARHMLKSPATVKLAEQVVTILLWNVPNKYRPLGKDIIATLMDERLRRAMDFSDPGNTLVKRINQAVALRKFLMRHLALPRPWALRYYTITMTRSKHNTNYMLEYDSLPYYVKPSIWNRWGIGALIRRYRGQPVPGDDGDKYYPHGYRTVDVGPNHGKLGQAKMEDSVTPVGQRRCPMAFT